MPPVKVVVAPRPVTLAVTVRPRLTPLNIVVRPRLTPIVVEVSRAYVPVKDPETVATDLSLLYRSYKV